MVKPTPFQSKSEIDSLNGPMNVIDEYFVVYSPTTFDDKQDLALKRTIYLSVKDPESYLDSLFFESDIETHSEQQVQTFPQTPINDLVVYSRETPQKLTTLRKILSDCVSEIINEFYTRELDIRITRTLWYIIAKKDEKIRLFIHVIKYALEEKKEKDLLLDYLKLLTLVGATYQRRNIGANNYYLDAALGAYHEALTVARTENVPASIIARINLLQGIAYQSIAHQKREISNEAVNAYAIAYENYLISIRNKKRLRANRNTETNLENDIPDIVLSVSDLSKPKFS